MWKFQATLEWYFGKVVASVLSVADLKVSYCVFHVFSLNPPLKKKE